MLRSRNQPFCGNLRLVVLVMLVISAYQEAYGQDEGKNPPSQRRWDEARKSMARFQVRKVTGDKRVALKLIEQPVFSFEDAVDQNNDGTLWLWGRTGRPSVVSQMWSDLPRVPMRYYTFTSLSTSRAISKNRLEAVGDGAISSVRWMPGEIGIEMKEFPEGPQPSSKESHRLIQMKRLASRFKAHEVYLEQRYELRLIPKAVHRYRDLESGLIDGAVFLWARGSDPEVLMLVELVKPEAEGSHWQYAFARVSHAELNAALNGTEVWSAPLVAGSRSRDRLRYALYGERLPASDDSGLE